MRKEPVTRQNAKLMGRVLLQDGTCYLGYSASEAGVYYDGEQLSAQLVTDDFAKTALLQGWIGVQVGDDEMPWRRFALTEGFLGEGREVVLFDRTVYARTKGIAVEALPKELPIHIVKYSEAAFGVAGIRYLLVDDEAHLRPLPEKKWKIEFIGDSITCGYGVEGVWNKDVFCTSQENPFQAYAVRLAKALDADYQLVSWSGIGLLTDWIPSERDEPDTTILIQQLYPYTDYSLANRLRFPQERWDVSRFLPDIVVINIGTNDDSYTRQKPEREAMFAAEYRKLYQCVRENYGGKTEIVCCLGIMQRTLCPVLEQLVGELRAEGDNCVRYIELEEQKEEDGIGTDWHPSAVTHAKAAKRLAGFLGVH